MSKGIICSIEPRTPFVGETHLYFHTSIGRAPDPKDKTKIFIALPEEKLRQLERHFTIHPLPGEILLTITRNYIQWAKFYPFGTRETPALRGTRIGELVHHAIVEHLADNYPNHTIYHSEAIEHARRKQLEGMKISPGQDYQIEAYRQLVRRHMEKRFRMRF